MSFFRSKLATKECPCDDVDNNDDDDDDHDDDGGGGDDVGEAPPSLRVEN